MAVEQYPEMIEENTRFTGEVGAVGFGDKLSSIGDKYGRYIGAGVAALTVGVLFGGTRIEQEEALNISDLEAAEDDQEQTTPPTTAEDEACAPGWEMPGVPVNEESRWFAEGIQEIQEAETEEEARDALDAWLFGTDEHPGVRDDATLLATAHKTITPLFVESVVFAEPEGLVDEEGCATERANELVIEMQAAIGSAEVEKVGEISEAGYNTGRTQEGVTVASEAGISGHTAAIKLSNAEGCNVYVLERCGQIYVTVDCGKPNLPDGPTDNPPVQPPENPNVPPANPPSTVKPKEDTQRATTPGETPDTTVAPVTEAPTEENGTENSAGTTSTSVTSTTEGPSETIPPNTTAPTTRPTTPGWEDIKEARQRLQEAIKEGEN